jgi:hypothetical protein
VQSGGTCTQTFATPGTGQSFTVPAGVTSVSVTLYGGTGGTNFDGNVPGGDGAQVTARLAVSPAEVLGVDVAGAGQGGVGLINASGGINGGGNGYYSGGGGGATDVTTSATRLLVAGGGGGAGANAGSFIPNPCSTGVQTQGGAGGNADNPGGMGQLTMNGGLTLPGGSGGSPGTTSAPGSGGQGGTFAGIDPCQGGVAANGSTGMTGPSSTGGSGDFTTYGGAGGGGYFGGGAGGEGATESPSLARGGSGGGGGGASYTGGAASSPAPAVADTGNNGTVNSGNGEAVLSWVGDPALHVTHIAAGDFYGGHAAAGVTFTDDDPNGNLSQYGGSIDWGDKTTTAIPSYLFFHVPQWLGGGFAALGFHHYAAAGTYTVTVTINDVGGASAQNSTTVLVRSSW